MQSQDGKVISLLNHGSRRLCVFILLLCIAGTNLATSGLILVISNIVHVDFEYTVSLSASGSNSVVSLTARVRFNGNPAGAGIAVDFYYSLNGGDWIYFATQPTNRGGVARVTYALTANGDYNFTATANIG